MECTVPWGCVWAGGGVFQNHTNGISDCGKHFARTVRAQGKRLRSCSALGVCGSISTLPLRTPSPGGTAQLLSEQAGAPGMEKEALS